MNTTKLHAGRVNRPWYRTQRPPGRRTIGPTRRHRPGSVYGHGARQRDPVEADVVQGRRRPLRRRTASLRDVQGAVLQARAMLQALHVLAAGQAEGEVRRADGRVEGVFRRSQSVACERWRAGALTTCRARTGEMFRSPYREG
eukprot:7384026-Prymnesium_polylepis.1